MYVLVAESEKMAGDEGSLGLDETPPSSMEPEEVH